MRSQGVTYKRQDAIGIEVFFGTNRKVKKWGTDQRPVEFGKDLNDTNPLLYFGKAKISNNVKKVEEVYTSRSDPSDSLCCDQDIFNEIQDRMSRGIDTILFFHGFRNTFHDSLLGVAQIKSLYERENNCEYTMVVLSWPSQGSFFSYGKDQDTADQSAEVLGQGIYQLNQFFTELCGVKDQRIISDREKGRNTEERNSCGRLHIMAYSMGSYVLRHTLQKLRNLTKDRIFQWFDEILLISADEAQDTLEHEDKLKFLPQLAHRVSIYFNREDIPLIISRLIGNDKRLGSEGPRHPSKLPSNVSLVNCSDVVKDFLEHNYHITEPAVYRDIAYVLAGWKSGDIPGRIYSPEANTYRLTDGKILHLLNPPPTDNIP